MRRFSFLESLRCLDCQAHHEPTYTLECPLCGGLLDPQYDLDSVCRVGAADELFRGLWRYHRVLPVRGPEHVISLGEGDTPLLEARRLGSRLGIPKLFLKYEGTLPTGTVKDRTSATAVSSALQFSFRAVSVVSTGNAGGSVATYARRAGLRSAIFCYRMGDPLKMAHMSLMATRLFTYDGQYDDVIELFDRIMDRKEVFDAGARRNPYKHEGKKTIAYEIVEQLGHAPEVFITQVSGCEIFTACFRGFREMMNMELIAGIPQMVACQSEAANPIARAFRTGRPMMPMTTGPTLAKGLATGKPGKKGQWVLEILREWGGLALDVSDREIVDARRLLVETEGIWSGPTGASALAGLIKGIREGLLDPEAEMVCMVTETGLTSPYPEPVTCPVEMTEEGISQALRGLG
ncbi:MAG: threonine synthase [Thermodesulfobacteriota bacterium]